MQGAVNSIVDGLFSALVTLGTVPIIKCPKVGNWWTVLAQQSNTCLAGPVVAVLVTLCTLAFSPWLVPLSGIVLRTCKGVSSVLL